MSSTAWQPFSIHRRSGREAFELCLVIDGELHVWRFAHGMPIDSASPQVAVYGPTRSLELLLAEGVDVGGAGAPSIVWDCGRYVCEEDPAHGMRRGKLRVELVGRKVRGRWAIGRQKGTWQGRGKPHSPTPSARAVSSPPHRAEHRPGRVARLLR